MFLPSNPHPHPQYNFSINVFRYRINMFTNTHQRTFTLPTISTIYYVHNPFSPEQTLNVIGKINLYKMT